MPSKNWKQLEELVAKLRDHIPQRTQTLSQEVFRNRNNYSILFRDIADSGLSEEMSAQKRGKVTGDPGFRMSISNLKRMLLNTTFVLDLDASGVSDYTKEFHRSNRDIYVLKSLTNFTARLSARTLAPEMLERARKYEFHLNHLEIVHFLRDDASMLGQTKKLKAFSDLANQLLQTIVSEEKAATLLEEILVRFARSGSEKPELAVRAIEYAKEVRRDFKLYRTFQLGITAFRLMALAKQIAFEYEATLKVCGDAIRFIESRPLFKSRGRLLEFEVKRMVCLLSLGRTDEGLATARRAESLVLSATSNWVLIKEFEYLLYMQKLDFDHAKAVLSEVAARNLFSLLPEHTRQKWGLYSLYLDYAVGASVRDEPAKLLKKIPAYHKDKAGYNSSLLILHTVLLIERREFGAVTDRVEALGVYSRRYLKTPGSEREYLFFRLLTVLESCSFDPSIAQRKGKKYLEAMLALKSKHSFSGPQILPYEYLWKRILSSLPNSKR